MCFLLLEPPNRTCYGVPVRCIEDKLATAYSRNNFVEGALFVGSVETNGRKLELIFRQVELHVVRWQANLNVRLSVAEQPSGFGGTIRLIASDCVKQVPLTCSVLTDGFEHILSLICERTASVSSFSRGLSMLRLHSVHSFNDTFFVLLLYFLLLNLVVSRCDYSLLHTLMKDDLWEQNNF